MRKIVCCIAAILLLAGCIPSLHPLYTEKDVFFDPALLGTWRQRGEEVSWAFSAHEPRAYRLVFADEKKREGVFSVRLLRLEGKMFLDLYPEDPAKEMNAYYKAHLVKAHTFMAVQQIEPVLRMSAMSHNWLDDLLKKNPGAIAHERRGNEIVFTAGTREMQAFVLKHLSTPEAFGKPTEMERAR
jgi:hypothetical protein